MAKRLQKTTVQQYEDLVKFVEKHKNKIISGKVNLIDVKKIDVLWEGFAKSVNNKGIGPVKTGKQWKKVYLQWKKSTKRRSRIFRELNTTGGVTTAKPLTDLDKRFLTLISNIYLGDYNVPGTMGVDENATLENTKPTLITNILCSNVSVDEDVETELLMDEEVTEVPSVPAELEFPDLVGSEENSAGSPEPSTSHMPPRSAHKSKYTPAGFPTTSSSNSQNYASYKVDLLVAAQAYRNEQDMLIKCIQENSAAINNLNVSITKLAESIGSITNAILECSNKNSVKQI